ncbi:autotransporter domain-containing protein [Ancylobacter sp. WKF20]|uniref:autotransporter domain-containing protein n=1 Tax=Ancylobacter sp. WKF20 TaxID=3039801 RepID=UPI002434359E|nr:autotransporter domain-containing protein [Ancylobacter sp. WKF20]WGD29314.1 autotransporter domain-containing protein [Ancylobacter sp. WKF20]
MTVKAGNGARIDVRRGDVFARAASARLRQGLLAGAALIPMLMGGGAAQAAPMPSACTVTGTTMLTGCDGTYASVDMTPGTGSLTVDSLVTVSVIYPSPLTLGIYNQTVTLTGTTVLDNPDYSALIMQFGTDHDAHVIAVTVNATVNIGSNVVATAEDGFGTIWVRNDYGGSVTIDNAGTITYTATNDGDLVAAISGVTNFGPVTITNSGAVTSNNAWGIYADGNYRGPTDGQRETVSVTNTESGVVTAYTAGIRVIDYYGLAELTNEGTVTSTLRQALVAWSNNGDTTITNSGTATSQNDNAVYAMTEIGKVTVTNSGTVTAYGDPTLDAAHIALTETLSGFNGLRGTAYTSGDIEITNEATGIVSAVRDAAILAETPVGDITITNAGQLTGKYGIVANSGFATGGSSATVPTTQGDIDVTNSGQITATDLAVSLDATTNRLDNSGTIETSGTTAVETGNGNSTVINSGTIAAATASDIAVSMGTGSNRFVLADTATVTGIVTNASSGNTLELTGSASGTFNLDSVNDTGAYRGFGNLEKSGTGTWVLTGESPTLTGTVTVSAGTLQVGNGGTSGTIAANVSIASGATLTINRSDDLVFANVISGTGSLVKDGANTLTLTGENTFSGVVTINAGTLQIGNGGATGSIAGDIVNNAALVFNRTGTYDFPGTITGSGSVTILSGTVNFIGASGYTGPIDVAGADLVLTEGSTSSSTFTVTGGGVLSGEGTIAGLSVGNGGSVAPGYSPGTLTVAGNVDFGGGSTYVVDIAADGTHDLILATGTATLSGGTVQVVAEAGYVTPLATYTILTAGGGLTGTFDTVSSNFAFLTPILGYDASNVYLTLARNDISFASVGQTANQQATGAGVETLGLGNPVYDAVLSISTTNAPIAFDALSGEAYATVTTIFAQQSSYLREAVGGRVRQGFAEDAAASGPQTAALTPGSGAVLWAQGYGAWGNNSSNGNAASADSTVGGFFAGADIPLGDSWRFGVLTGYSRSTIDVDDRGSSADSDNYDLGLYGGARYGALGVLLGASYTWHDVSMSRSIAFPGYAGAASSSYDAATAQLFGELSWRVPVAQALPGLPSTGTGAYVEPFAGLAYVSLTSDDFTETGSTAALTGSAADENVFYSTLGIRAATEVELKGGVKARPYLSLGWQYAFGDVDPTATLAFASGSAAFQVSGLPIAQNTALVGLGLDVALSDTVRAGVSYGGQFASDASDNTFKGSLNIRF